MNKSYYFDSSAVVKLYVEEEGSDTVVELSRESSNIFTSTVSFPEVISALCRKKRLKEAPEGKVEGAVALFEGEWERFMEVYVSDEIRLSTKDILTKNPLKGCDAIHLASILYLSKTILIRFVTADGTLEAAAKGEGIDVINPLKMSP